MHKRNGLRMTAGDYVLYGSHARMDKCIRGDGFHWGQVRRVTPKGGILVDCLHPNGVTPKGYTEWVPYHFVLKHVREAAHDVEHRPEFRGAASGTVRT